MQRAFLVAEPHFFSTGGEVKFTLVFQLLPGVPGRYDFDADFWRDREDIVLQSALYPAFGDIRDIHAFDAIPCQHGAFSERAAPAHEDFEEVADFQLKIGMSESRWRHHDDVSVAVGFDAVRPSLQAGVGAHLLPALQMKRGGILDAGDVEQRRHDGEW